MAVITILGSVLPVPEARVSRVLGDFHPDPDSVAEPAAVATAAVATLAASASAVLRVACFGTSPVEHDTRLALNNKLAVVRRMSMGGIRAGYLTSYD